MGTIRDKNLLSELRVKESMRHQLVTLSQDASLEQSIRHLVKFKVSGLLITDNDSAPVGVLSKTDLMGAYYAGLPVEGPVSDIMVTPPLFCQEEESLEQVLQTMRDSRVYRLYVQDKTGTVKGVIAYPDIVGMLYSFCRDCEQSKWQRLKKSEDSSDYLRYKVSEIMTQSVTACCSHDSLTTIMEGLSTNQIGAVLIIDSDDKPVGVVSKTDLILAYRRGVIQDMQADAVMSRPVRFIDQRECLETALHQLIFLQLHRLFVSNEETGTMVGVLSLSDAARMRSGSCHACIMSRIKVEE